MEQLEKNKDAVKRFNKELIEDGNTDAVKDLFDENFINHSARAGSDNGPDGMIAVFNSVRPAISGMKVSILLQVAEEDLVTTRKIISGLHTGNLMGVPASGKKIEFEVIDIVRIRNGKYFEHWGVKYT